MSDEAFVKRNIGFEVFGFGGFLYFSVLKTQKTKWTHQDYVKLDSNGL